MIKKSGAILLTTLYIITVFGFALNLHFCFGQLDSVKIDAPAKTCKLPTAKTMKCCANKQLTVKVKDAHQAETTTFIAALFAVDLPKSIFGDYHYAAQQTAPKQLASRGPPDIPPAKIACFIKNCTFRI